MRRELSIKFHRTGRSIDNLRFFTSAESSNFGKN